MWTKEGESLLFFFFFEKVLTGKRLYDIMLIVEEAARSEKLSNTNARAILVLLKNI